MTFTFLGHALAKINPGANEQDNPALLTFQKLCWIFTRYLRSYENFYNSHWIFSGQLRTLDLAMRLFRTFYSLKSLDLQIFQELSIFSKI